MPAEPWQRATPGSACLSPLAAIDFRKHCFLANCLWSFGSLALPIEDEDDDDDENEGLWVFVHAECSQGLSC